MYNIVKVVIKSVFFTTPLLTDEYNLAAWHKPGLRIQVIVYGFGADFSFLRIWIILHVCLTYFLKLSSNLFHYSTVHCSLRPKVTS